MGVFEADRILDYAELFVSTGQKPTFKKSKATDKASEQADAFDDMMGEAEQKPAEAKGGLLPECLKKTQEKPDGPLQ